MVGDCGTVKVDPVLGVLDATEEARDVLRLSARSILDATLAPELLEPFSLTVSGAWALIA